MRYYIRHVRTGQYVRAAIDNTNVYTSDKREAIKPSENQVHELLRRLRGYGMCVTFEAVK